jgi:hypothetical protein
MLKFIRKVFRKVIDLVNYQEEEGDIKTVKPPCARNTSFWLPKQGDDKSNYFDSWF